MVAIGSNLDSCWNSCTYTEHTLRSLRYPNCSDCGRNGLQRRLDCRFAVLEPSIPRRQFLDNTGLCYWCRHIFAADRQLADSKCSFQSTSRDAYITDGPAWIHARHIGASNQTGSWRRSSLRRIKRRRLLRSSAVFPQQNCALRPKAVSRALSKTKRHNTNARG